MLGLTVLFLLPSVPVSEGIEIRHGCQFLSSLVRPLAKLPGGLGRFLPCSLGSHMSRLRHVGWNPCSHGLNSRPLESCHHQCLEALCGVSGYPKGSALELLDGTLKLRHCTDLFIKRFPPWSLPRVGSGIGKRNGITPGHSSDTGGNCGKGAASHVIPDPDPGHSTPRRWKRLRPLPPKEREVRWACLAIFFLALRLGDDFFCTRGRLEPAFGGNRHRGFCSGWSVQPKGSVRWHQPRFH